MLPASAWALLAFFLRSARPARRRVRGAVVARGRDSAPADHLRVQDSKYGHILYYLARVAASCRRLAQWFDTVV
jgi:hypothetical protein